jgi:hypothetical protein
VTRTQYSKAVLARDGGLRRVRKITWRAGLLAAAAAAVMGARFAHFTAVLPHLNLGGSSSPAGSSSAGTSSSPGISSSSGSLRPLVAVPPPAAAPEPAAVMPSAAVATATSPPAGPAMARGRQARR